MATPEARVRQTVAPYAQLVMVAIRTAYSFFINQGNFSLLR